MAYYLPLAQHEDRDMNAFYVRTSGDPAETRGRGGAAASWLRSRGCASRRSGPLRDDARARRPARGRWVRPCSRCSASWRCWWPPSACTACSPSTSRSGRGSWASARRSARSGPAAGVRGVTGRLLLGGAGRRARAGGRAGGGPIRCRACSSTSRPAIPVVLGGVAVVLLAVTAAASLLPGAARHAGRRLGGAAGGVIRRRGRPNEAGPAPVIGAGPGRFPAARAGGVAQRPRLMIASWISMYVFTPVRNCSMLTFTVFG